MLVSKGVNAMLNLNKFTLKAQEAVQSAYEMAQRSDHQEVDCLHLLGAMLRLEGGIAAQILEKIGVRNDDILREIDSALKSVAKVE